MEKTKQTFTGCPETSQAGRAEVCNECPGQALCKIQGRTDPDQDDINIRMNAVRHKILVMSGKGGVGKSTVASSLAIRLGQCGNKVGLVDLDICGPNQPKLMGVDGQQIVSTQWGWKPLVSPHGAVKVISVGSLLATDDTSVVFRGPRKTHIVKQFLKDVFWGKLDYLIFDTPPGTSDEHLTVIKILQKSKPDGAVIVTTPQQVALGTVRKQINFCRKMRLNVIGLVENMNCYACPCCGELTELFSTKGGEQLASEYEINFLGSLPLDMALAESCDTGQNILSRNPENQSVKALFEFAENVARTVESG